MPGGRLTARIFSAVLAITVVAVAALAIVPGHPLWLRLLAAAVVVVAAGATGVWLWSRLEPPARSLRRAADAIAGGETDVDPLVADAGDFAELADALDAMAESVRSRTQRLTEERDRSEQILEALDDGVLLVDGEGKVLLANRAARIWFGIEEQFHPGLSVNRAFGVPVIGELASEAATEGAVVTGLVTLVFPAHRTLAVRAVPLIERASSGRTVVTLTDVTERRRVEALRRDFVTNASHELKTPVASLRALAETLGTALPDDPETASHFVTRIEREAARLDRLVQDLLDLSRVERGTLAVESVDVESLVHDIASTYAERADEGGVALRFDADADTSVRGDRAQLELMLSNLVDNALRYTPPGGVVDIRVRATSDVLTIEVADTGMGIPKDELPRIFERFYRVDKARARRTGGTGLGLAIVRHVAESHGGTVAATSALGRGTTLTVQLPVGGPAADGDRAARSATEDADDLQAVENPVHPEPEPAPSALAARG